MSYGTRIGVEQTTESRRTQARDGARVLRSPDIVRPGPLAHSATLAACSFPAHALVPKSPPANCREWLFCGVEIWAVKGDEKHSREASGRKLLAS